MSKLSNDSPPQYESHYQSQDNILITVIQNEKNLSGNGREKWMIWIPDSKSFSIAHFKDLEPQEQYTRPWKLQIQVIEGTDVFPSYPGDMETSQKPASLRLLGSTASCESLLFLYESPDEALWRGKNIILVFACVICLYLLLYQYQTSTLWYIVHRILQQRERGLTLFITHDELLAIWFIGHEVVATLTKSLISY